MTLVLAEQGKWAQAWETIRPLLDATSDSKAAQERATEFVTEFLIQAAAEGQARDALETLTTSKGAAALEPLIVGLRVYLGESPQVAKEILEIGHDIAERISKEAHADDQQNGANGG